MPTDDALVTMALAAPRQRLTGRESDTLMEFLFRLRSGQALSASQKAELRQIAGKALGERAVSGG